MTKPVRLAATDQVRGSNSNRGGRPVVAFAGAVALLAAGGAAATFLIGGDQTRAAATDAPQVALGAIAQQLPVKTVKTVTIKADPEPDTTKAGLEPAPQPPASNALDASAVDALPPEDPRWARGGGGRTGKKSASDAPNALQALNTPAGAIVLGALAASEKPSDPMATAAIFPDAQSVLKTRPPVSPQLAVPAPEMPIATEQPAPRRTVRVNDDVNLRARGVSGSRVLRTIPGNASVGLVGCKDWCEVVYEGTRGFIYKSFIGGRRAPAERVAATAPEQAVPVATAAPAAEPKAQPKPTPWRNKHEDR